MSSICQENKKIEKILKNSILSGLLLVLFVPLMVIKPLAYPLVTVKGFAFRAIMEIVFFLWIVLVSMNARYRPDISRIGIGLTLFVVILMIADIFGVSPTRSFWSDYNRMEGWILIIHLWAYFLVMISMFKQEIWWFRVFNTTIFVAILMAGYAYLQLLLPKEFLFNSNGRIDALLGNSSFLSIYLVLHIFFCLFFIFRVNTPKWQKTAYCACSVLLAIPLLYTGTRGSVVALIGGLSLAALLSLLFEKSDRSARMISTTVLAVLVLSLACFYAARNTHFVKSNFFLSRTATLFQLSAGGDRYHIWGMAVKGIWDRPVLGRGQENFNYVFNQYYTPEYQQEEWFDRTHNIFLELAVAGGFLLLFSYIAIYALAYFNIWKGNCGLSVIQKSLMIGMSAAYIIHNCFVFDSLSSYIIFMIFLAYAHFTYHAKQRISREIQTDNDVSTGKKKDKAQNQVKEKIYIINKNVYLSILLPTSFILLLLALYFVVIKPSAACHALNKALIATTGRDKLVSYMKALSYRTAYAQDIREHLEVDSVAILATLTEREALETKLYIKKELEQQVEESPNDVKAHAYLSDYLGEIGMLDEAEKHARFAVNYSPQKQSFLFNLGQICFSNKKFDEAYQIYKKAYELNSSSDYAKRSYAKISIFMGYGDQVFEIVKPYMKMNNIDQSVIGAFLATDANKALMVDFYERIKQEDPQNMLTRAYLVNAYAHVDDKKKAYAEIDEMKRDFPQISKQLDSLISSVYRFKPFSGDQSTTGSRPLIEKYVPKTENFLLRKDKYTAPGSFEQ